MKRKSDSAAPPSSGIPRARARFLAQAIELEEQGPSAAIRGAVYVIALMLSAFVLWAWSTSVNEVAIAGGEVVPAGLIHDVQHLEGGVVAEINVRNGDLVRSGDPLLRFTPEAVQSELDRTLVRQATLRMDAERLQALIEGRAPELGETGSRYPLLAQKQRNIYLAQLASHDTELGVIDAQIRQREMELERLDNQAKSIEKELNLLAEQAEIRSELTRKKIGARTDLLTAQTRLAEGESERRTILDGIGVARSALEEAEQRRLETAARFSKELRMEAGATFAELAEVEQALVRLEDRASRLDIQAPVDGIVQALSITRINAVVEPAQVIMQIVPVSDDLMVEARVSPNDIGHIHPGQEAEVRVDSYDSSRFGSMGGSIRRISASTYLDGNRHPYYLAEIELEKSFLGDDPDQLRVIPGMTVVAAIKTGSKTILDYLLKPVSRGFDNAFGER